jgi:hypothetical protein
VRIDKNYVFDTPEGQRTLADLFDGRRQLLVQHFMFGPGWEQGCPSCSFMADHSDGMTVHLAHRDVTLVGVSRAPLADIERFRRRMGWQFKWVSSHGSDFNYDFGVSFTWKKRSKASSPTTSAHGRSHTRNGLASAFFLKDRAIARAATADSAIEVLSVGPSCFTPALILVGSVGLMLGRMERLQKTLRIGFPMEIPWPVEVARLPARAELLELAQRGSCFISKAHLHEGNNHSGMTRGPIRCLRCAPAKFGDRFVVPPCQ